MEEIFSKIKPEVLLHVVNKLADTPEGRKNLLSDDSSLQVAMYKGLDPSYGFKGPHKHTPNEKVVQTTQETWFVFSGKLKINMYDLDNKKIAETILGPGDSYIYIAGGHSPEVVEEGTVFYEVKNGPYLGKDKEKIAIEPT